MMLLVVVVYLVQVCCFGAVGCSVCGVDWWDALVCCCLVCLLY